MKFRFLTYKIFFAIAAILLFLTPQSVEAQRSVPKNLQNYDNQLYHFGFILAFNQMSFNVDYVKGYQLIDYDASQSNNKWDTKHWDPNYKYNVVGVAANSSPGFTVGIVGNLRLGRYFDLRLIPSLSFGKRDLKYYMYYEDTTDPSNNGFYLIDSNNTLWDAVIVEFPLHVKYKSKRLNNFAAYVIGGTNFKLDATGRKNKVNGEINKVKTRLCDLAAEIGAGVDFYNSYFKFGIEVKMGWGLLNVLDKENQILDSSFDKLRNNTFQISLTFE